MPSAHGPALHSSLRSVGRGWGRIHCPLPGVWAFFFSQPTNPSEFRMENENKCRYQIMINYPGNGKHGVYSSYPPPSHPKFSFRFVPARSVSMNMGPIFMKLPGMGRDITV